MTSHWLTRFVSPQSIAIIGASQDMGTIAGKPLRYLTKHGYAGRIYPINPRYDRIEGLRCYAGLADVPERIDLALVVVAAKRILGILEQCVDVGVAGAAIISSGFAEAGEEGRKLQEQIATLCKKTGLRVSGPNSQGYLNLYDHVSATFSPALDLPELITGGLGLVSQSGAVGFSTFSLGQDEGIGFSHVISTGNEVDLTWLDAVDYMIADPRTRTIAAYVEGVRDGRRFAALAQEAQRAGKQLIVLKVGRTDVGSRAAASHTAAISGADFVFNAACRQYGVVRARDIGEIFDFARALSLGRSARANRVGILTTSGGAGVMAADEAVELGLRVEPLAEATRQSIQALIPAFGSAQNPVDVTAEVLRRPETFREALRLILNDESVDLLAVVLTMVTGERAVDRARDIAEVIGSSEKPVAVSWSASERLAGSGMERLRAASIPLYPTPVRMIRALKILHDRSEFARACRPSHIDGQQAATRRVVHDAFLGPAGLNEYEAKRLLAAYGIPVARERLADSPRAAAQAAAEMGYPVAVKIVSSDVRHKTEAGGVRLNLRDASEVVAASTAILSDVRKACPAAHIDGLLVQEMVSKGTEMIAGTLLDPDFGPILMVGGGGVFVEMIRDVSYRVAPVGPAEVESMIDELKCARALAGARGQAHRDRAALVTALCRLSELAVDLQSDLREIEINPLVVLPDGEGVRAVDALVVPREREAALREPAA